MSHHLNKQGLFKNDQYPSIQPDEIVQSFKAPDAMKALYAFCDQTEDDGLAMAVVKRLNATDEEVWRGDDMLGEK